MNGKAAWGTAVLACLLLATGGLPTPSVAGIDDGLIAYWNFDDCSADDSSGYSRHGTIQGSPECVDSPLQGKALRFQGTGEWDPTGDHILLPSIDFPSLGEFSICLWVNEQVLEHPHGEAYINWGWGSWGEWVVIGRFADPDGDNLWFSTGGESPIKVPFDAESDQNRFVHYCLVHGSYGITKGYKDFQLVGEKSQPVVVGGDPGMAAIARHWWVAGSVTRFTGLVDEVRVYDRALSEEEILALNPEISSAAIAVARAYLHFAPGVEAEAGQPDEPADDAVAPQYAGEGKDVLRVRGTLDLSEESDGIDPMSEPVTLSAGIHTVEIPAGSFRWWSQEGAYGYASDYNGGRVWILLKEPSGYDDTWEYRAGFKGVDNSGTSNPITVKLTVGDDGGQTEVKLFGTLSYRER